MHTVFNIVLAGGGFRDYIALLREFSMFVSSKCCTIMSKNSDLCGL